MSGNVNAAARDINSAKPFETYYAKYRQKGWLGTLPLPAKRKETPPDNFTGFRPGVQLVAEQTDIDGWLRDPRWYKGNICLRLGQQFYVDGQMFEIIGLDVDQYDSKQGGSEFSRLQTRYGQLPDTWISTSRTDGVSGIRFFRVRPGLAFMGKAGNAIEVIQRRHRYAVVYPSWHPSTGNQYYWYAPGNEPNGKDFSSELPDPCELPLLPDKWVKFLTRGYMEDPGSAAMDMDSSDKEIQAWAANALVDGTQPICGFLQQRLNSRKEELLASNDHHDPMTQAHWEFLHLGSEGHAGWLLALKEYNDFWLNDILSQGKRPLHVCKAEILRSRDGTLRKIKGASDEGTLSIVTEDPCAITSLVPPGDGFGVPPNGNVPLPNHWERNENGNAKHFIALYGNNIRYVPNHPSGGGKWIIFDENTNRWIVDAHDVRIHTLFRYVEKRQRVYSEMLWDTFRRTADPNDEKRAKAWTAWSNGTGNKQRIANSLVSATRYEEVVLDYQELDNDPYLVPVANGLIRFATAEERRAGKKPFEWVGDPQLCKEHLVTQNTNVPYIPFEEQVTHSDPEIRANAAKFQGYLRKFLVEPLSEAEWQYARLIFGYSLLGVNAKKALFLYGPPDTGKSTWQNMMNEALGDLAIGREARIFLDTQFKGSLAEALPRRVCMVGELGEKELDAGLFKTITGNDVVDCQLKNINKPVSMRARCMIISSCNQPPDVPKVDEATKRRFVVIPFRHQVSGAEKDTAAQDYLMEHCKLPMLAFLIEACADAIVSDLEAIPDALRIATQDFVSHLSDFSDFVNDCLARCDPADWDVFSRNDQSNPLNPLTKRWPDEKCVGDRTAYKAYCEYARVNNMELYSKNKWTRRMKDAGFVQDGSWTKDNEKRWIGITLKSNGRVMFGYD